MRITNKRLPCMTQVIAGAAMSVAQDLDMNVYLVGGCVRDMLLHRENLDIDLVVEGDGILFSRRLAEKVSGRLVDYPRFGTATIFSSDYQVDIATARKEMYLHSGSLPQVSSGSLRDDLFRRDFTVNALALDLSSESYLEVIDLFGGLRDLKRKVLRIFHPRSFIDDPTRIFRAIRFLVRFKFHLSGATALAMKHACKENSIQRVSGKRIANELERMFQEENPYDAVRCLFQFTGFKFLENYLSLTANQVDTINSALRCFAVLRSGNEFDTTLFYFLGFAVFGSMNPKEFCDFLELPRHYWKRISKASFLHKQAQELEKIPQEHRVLTFLKEFSPEEQVILYWLVVGQREKRIMRKSLLSIQKKT